ncbi:MAG: HDOD domain-containing protein [Gammaproteobacteria bacterium]|jgi:EAL and modified HD-GYP domain-containing signal transduction protein
MQQIYIGRQPIFDRKQDLFAYELLYRANNVHNAAGVIDQDHATTQVVINACLDFGLKQLVGEKKAFINLPRSFIVGDKPILLPNDQVILEILEDIEIDDALLRSLRQLRTQGYQIALDDFTYHAELRPLITLSKIVKIDFRALSPEQIREHVEVLKDYKIDLLAEKIETHQEFEFAKELGFHYFQGYFLCRPHIVTGRSLASNRMAILRLLCELLDPNKNITELAELVSHDVALSFKLLRSLNSPFCGLPERIDSVHHAIAYLGLQQIKQWASLIVLANITDKPSQLMVMALTRGKMCELVGEAMGVENTASLFTVGMLSLLDALMDNSLETVLLELPLAAELKAAILNREGAMGGILRAVLAYEQGHWEVIDICLPEAGKFTEAYMQAVAWSDQVYRHI